MTGKERIQNILAHKLVDRIGVFEHFWTDTYNAWSEKGHIAGESYDDHFEYDMSECWPFNLVADLDYEPEILEETEETVLIKDGNGAILRRHKLHDSTPEHVDFTVKEREDWEKLKPLLTEIDERRIDFETYRKIKKDAEEHGRFFACGGVHVFEYMSYVCGHENMLMGMITDSEWILDMTETYSNLMIELQKILLDFKHIFMIMWQERRFRIHNLIISEQVQSRNLKAVGHQDFANISHNGLSLIVYSVLQINHLRLKKY